MLFNLLGGGITLQVVLLKLFMYGEEFRNILLYYRLNFNIGRYNTAFKKGLEQYADLDLAKSRAASIKRKVVNNLDQYLIEFEQNFTANGGKVIWAVDAEEARVEVLKIIKKHKAKQVVKMKSMTTEEIELNAFLEKEGIESIETDLGEYIVQLVRYFLYALEK